MYNRKQCLQIKRLSGLHHDLCRRSPLHRSTEHHQHALQRQKEVLLRHTGDLTVGSTIHFLGRNISHKGDYIDISLNNTYVDIILEETTCNPAPSPGVQHMKGTAEDEAPLDQEQLKKYRRLVGKIQWLAYTRPDISYGAKELARSLQAPAQLDNKKLKHMIRDLKRNKVLATQPATKATNTGQTNSTQH